MEVNMNQVAVKKKVRPEGVSTVSEKIRYGLESVGGGSFAWTFVAGFITLYFTNSVGIAAGTVGTMMLIARLVDGLSDIVMGAILERTHTRFGKVRPWYLVTAPLLAISVFLCFNFPGGLSAEGKVIFMYITYIPMCIVYTMYSLPDTAMIARMSTDPNDQSKIATVKMTFVMLFCTIVYMLTTILLTEFGGMNQQSAWTKVSGSYAIIIFVLIMLGFTIREKVKDQPVDAQGAVKAGKVPLKVALGAAAKNREFYVLLVLFFLVYTSSGLIGSGTMYYVGYVLSDFTKVSLTMIGSLICQLVLMLICPILFKRFGKMKVLRLSCLLAAVASLVRIIDPSSFPLFLAGTWMVAAFTSPIYVAMFTLVADLITYVAMKTGVRAEGFVSMIATIGTKVGTGIGTALVGWLLQWGAFNGMVLVQPQSAIKSLIVMVVILPAIISLLQFVVLLFWKVDKKIDTFAKAA